MTTLRIKNGSWRDYRLSDDGAMTKNTAYEIWKQKTLAVGYDASHIVCQSVEDAATLAEELGLADPEIEDDANVTACGDGLYIVR
jgi:hypothetical protein